MPHGRIPVRFTRQALLYAKSHSNANTEEVQEQPLK